MRLLLISFNQQDVAECKIAPADISAIGLRYLSSYLKKQGHEVKILFLTKPYKQLEKKSELKLIDSLIQNLNPDLVGMGLMSNHFFRAKQLTEFLKEKFYDLPVIWGGIHPTIRPEECLDYADLVCVGEGEIAMANLVNEWPNLLKIKEKEQFIPGIWHKKEGKKIANGIAPLIEDINNLPYPDYDFENHYIIHQGKMAGLTESIFQQYYPISRGDLRLITSRGCPHFCAYCCNSVFHQMYGGKFLRLRETTDVINEMAWLKNKMPYVKSFKIMDDSFFVNNLAWISDFSQQYKEQIKLPFFCLVSPLTISREKLDVLVGCGLKSVQIGLQSGSDRINKNIYLRNISSGKFLSALEIIDEYRHKLNIIVDVIVDNPYETEDDLLITAKILNKIKRPFHLDLFSLSFYPGTELHRRATQEGKITDQDEYLFKEFHLVRNNYLNKLIFLVPHLNPTIIEKFIKEYRQNMLFKLYISILSFIFKNKNRLPPQLLKIGIKMKKIIC